MVNLQVLLALATSAPTQTLSANICRQGMGSLKPERSVVRMIYAQNTKQYLQEVDLT